MDNHGNDFDWVLLGLSGACKLVCNSDLLMVTHGHEASQAVAGRSDLESQSTRIEGRVIQLCTSPFNTSSHTL